MLHDLPRRDLSEFDIRQIPQSKALGEQKLLSLDAQQKWWMDKLVAGELVDGCLVHPAWGPVTKEETETEHAKG